MLLRFTVENLFCFAQEAEFSMVASKDNAHPDHLIPAGKHKALRISALYGANAHGKSRLVRAMSFARDLIVDGTKPNKKIPVTPFRLDPELLNRPSRFEFTLVAKGVEYTYGFVVDSNKVHEEWLFSRPNRVEVRLFERTMDAHGKTDIQIGHSLARAGTSERKFVDFLIKGVRDNQLFLTECADRNFAKLESLYRWFQQKLYILSPGQPLAPVGHLLHRDKKFSAFVNEYLKMADTGISEINIKEDKPDLELIFPDLEKYHLDEIKRKIESGSIIISDESQTVCTDTNGVSLLEIVTQHRAIDGQNIQFRLEEESSGTLRFLQILPILYYALDPEHVFVIDELDRTLHPALSRLIIETFLKITEKSQIIFTTHESTLLDTDILRRDEIWFVEKDEHGKAILYPLNSFKIRPDLKIERSYLQGRFGAIPFIRNHALSDE